MPFVRQNALCVLVINESKQAAREWYLYSHDADTGGGVSGIQ
jgi:hypothetical protein